MISLVRLLPYYRAYRWTLAAGLACVVLASASASTVPWLLRAGVDGLRGAAPPSHVWAIAATMLGVAFGTGALRYLMREWLNGISRRIEYDLRNDLFARLVTLDPGWYARTRTGDIMARLTNDLGAVRMAAGPAIMYFTNTIFGGVFALAFMLHIDPRLTGLALLPVIVLPLLTVRLGRLVHDRFEAVQEHFSTMTTRAHENLAGTRIVRAYRQETAEIARYEALGQEYVRRNMKLAQLSGIMNPLFALLAGLGAVTVLGFGGMLALRGTISIGSFVAFGLYLGMLTWPLIALGWVINLFQRGAASMTRLLDILDAQPAIADPITPRALPPIGALGGRALEFRGVGFHYPAAEGHAPRWVLREISFTVRAGDTLGIVGATGSGKSALLELIPRLHDPQAGQILLDGVPLRDLPLAAMRREIGMVPQESLLFSDTIASNLQYGLTGPDESASRWAANVAELDATIADFPGSYNTMLGERGINLSGGQKQRAALARALARKPAIVLLDDALAAVDTHTEAEILRGLRTALAGRTALIASHRISAIRDASWIIVLDDGRIVEQGKHDDLLARGGRYWALLRRQQLRDAIEEDAAAPGREPAGAAD